MLPAFFVYPFTLVVAQSWCPPGAEWSHYYSYTDWITSITEIGILDSQYAGDTLINGSNCQRIAHDFYYDIQGGAQDQHRSGTPTITRYVDSVVYILSPFSGQFDTLLWFAAEPGDHWPVYSVGSSTHWVVNDVELVEEEGVSLKKMAVSWVDMSTSGQLRTDTIYERVGPAWSFVFYPFNVYVDFQYFDLRCYRDQDLTWSRSATTDCEFPAGIREMEAGIAAKVFPNPGSDQLEVEGLANILFEVRVTDATGRTMARVTDRSGRTTLNTNSWASGLYHVRVLTANGSRSLKWVKQ